MRDASSSSPLGDGVARAARANAATTATTAAGDEQAATVSQERLAAPAAPAMQLLVRHKRTVTVDGLRAEDDVSVLAARIERKTRVPRAKSWLQFEHTRLEPGRSLGACGLSAGSTVHLAVRGRGGGRTDPGRPPAPQAQQISGGASSSKQAASEDAGRVPSPAAAAAASSSPREESVQQQGDAALGFELAPVERNAADAHRVYKMRRYVVQSTRGTEPRIEQLESGKGSTVISIQGMEDEPLISKLKNWEKQQRGARRNISLIDETERGLLRGTGVAIGCAGFVLGFACLLLVQGLVRAQEGAPPPPPPPPALPATTVCLHEPDTPPSALITEIITPIFFNATCLIGGGTGEPCDLHVAEEYTDRMFRMLRVDSLVAMYVSFIVSFSIGMLGGIPRATDWNGLVFWLAWMCTQLAMFFTCVFGVAFEVFAFLSIRNRLAPCLVTVDQTQLLDFYAMATFAVQPQVGPFT